MRLISSAVTTFRLILAAILLQSVMPAIAAPFVAFADGETFTYRASWGIFFRAGAIIVAAHAGKDANGAAVFHITTDTATRGIIRGFYPYTNRAEAIIDQQTGRLVFMQEKGSDGRRVTDNETTFDYRGKSARYVDRAHPARTQSVPIPDGDPIDLLSALVQTREWNLQPGQKKDVLVSFGNEFFPIAIYADHYEVVRTPLGTYQTLVLVPRMEQNPKGIFKRGGEIKVWISQQGQKLPVKLQLKLGFGTATLLLAEYRPGRVPFPSPAP
jgi:hypothetical protein